MTETGFGLLLGVAGLGLGFFLGSLHGQVSPDPSLARAPRLGVVAEAFEAVERLDRSAGRLTAASPARAAGPDRREASDITGSVAAEDGSPRIVCRWESALAPGDDAPALLRR